MTLTTPVPPPPSEDPALKARQYEDELRKRKGRASAVLTQKRGEQPETAAQVLLGS